MIQRILGSIIIIAVLAAGTAAEVFTSIALQEGYNSNLFYNATEESGSFTSVSTDLIFYPSDDVEISLFGDYILYPSTDELSNYLFGGSVTAIPTDEFSRSKIMLYATGSILRYKDIYDIYSNSYAGGSCSWQYSLTPSITTSTGISANYFDYPETESATDLNYSVFGGLNMTVLKNNSINFEISLLEQEFSYNTLDTTGMFNRTRLVENKDKFSSTDYSIRFSRPLDIRTGLSLSYQKRSFDAQQEFTYTGFALDYLSPVASLWDGDIVTIGIKRFLPAQIIGNFSGSYLEKSYTQTGDTQRRDIQRSLAANLQKTYLTKKMMIVPQISFQYTSQSSTIELFYYTLMQLSVSLNVMF